MKAQKYTFFFAVQDFFHDNKRFGKDLLSLHFQNAIRMIQVRSIILLLTLLFIASGMQAQNYIIEVDRGGNTTALYKPEKTNIVSDPYVVGEGEIVGWLHNGDKVTIAEEDKDYIRSLLPEEEVECVLVTINGEKYFVSMKDLKFGDNPADVEDWVKENRQSSISTGKIILWVIIGGIALLGIYGAISPRNSKYSGSYSDSDNSSDWKASMRAEEEERKREEREEAARRRRDEEEKWYRNQQQRINKGKTDLWS